MQYQLGTGEFKNWIVAEDSFQPDHLGKCESIMCLGNGYMGIRSATEEDYLGNTRDTFVAGTFNKFGDEVTELPNAADVIAMPIRLNGELLDLSKGTVENYLRTLNLKSGLLKRSFTWTSPAGARLRFLFKRIVSMKDLHLIAQEMSVTALDSDVKFHLESGINGQVSNTGSQHFVEGEKRFFDKKFQQSVMKTSESGIDFVVNTTHSFFFNEEEWPKWEEKVGKIYLPRENENHIIPQDDTYLTLPEVDLSKYKASDVVGTIYNDYNMEQIDHMQVSKQADVLVLFYLMEDLFPAEVKKANFYYYEERCLHDSSLSLSTHSILASDLHEREKAYELFERACRIDLGPVMTTSDAGTHAASLHR